MASIAGLKKDFKKMIESGALAHGYILFGHESAAEKLQFVKELASFFESKKWEIGDRPLSDALILDAGDGEKGIDVVRSASAFLWQKPVVSMKRTLVIANADRLTPQAQNAILKIAEEPPAHALLFLITKDPEALLSPVTSRFQKIFIAKEKDAALVDGTAAKAFLKMNPVKRKEYLKDLMDEIKEAETDVALDAFVTGLFAELQKDPMRNFRSLKGLLERWSLIRQFNVNKRLQLEVALQNL